MYIFFPSRFGLGMTFVQEKKKFTHSNTKTKPLWVFCQKKKKRSSLDFKNGLPKRR